MIWTKSFVIILCTYIAGIVLAPYVPLSQLSLVLLLLLCLLAAQLNKAFAWRKNKAYLLLSVFLLGLLMFQWQSEKNRGNIDALAGKYVILQGTVIKEPDLRSSGVNYVINVENEVTGILGDKRPEGLILLTTKQSAEPFSYGDKLEISGVPEVPEEPGNPGEFNYRKYLASKGIHLIIQSWQGSGARRIGPGKINFIVDAALKVKQRFVSVLDRTLSARNSALMEGILLGADGRIDNEIKNDFALTGVIHILSVSGYHVALLVAASIFLGRFLNLNRSNMAFVVIAVTAFYALMTGANPPVIRAVIMAWLLLLSGITGRRYDWSGALSAAALMILLADPAALYSPGFQLSFAATWGIFYITPGIEKYLPFHEKLNKALAGTLAAQLAVLPLTAYYFNYVSLLSILANILIVPMVSLAMLLGTISILGGLIWLPFAGIVNISTGIIIDLVVQLAHLLGQVYFAVITVKQPPVGVVVGLYIMIFALLISVNNPDISIRIRKVWVLQRTQSILVLLTFVTVLIWLTIVFPAKGELDVTFVDIGQGDAILINCPGGRNIMIDTGGAQSSAENSFNPGEKVLVPLLRRQGIDHIDLLFLTHPHWDHIQGAEALIKHMKIEMLAISPQFKTFPEGERITKLFAEKGTKIREFTRGDKVLFDENIVIDVISPDNIDGLSENNSSLVMKLTYGDFSVLFTGDAEQPVLEQITRNYPRLAANIVKVPHHGSKNAWTKKFYSELSPSLAVISVGAHNYFGHPSHEIVEGMGRLRIPVLRTDRNGAVMIESDGRSFKIKTGKGMD